MITKEMWEGRFVDNEMTAEYFDICSKPYDGVGEKHHILPKSLWPEFSKAKWNLVNLSYRNHYKAHELLTQICSLASDRQKMALAWSHMRKSIDGDVFITEERYAELRDANRHLYSGENHPMYGKTHTSEVVEAMTQRSKEQWSCPELRVKQSETIKGLWEEPEYRERMTEINRRIAKDPNRIAKHSAKMKEIWSDDEYKANMMEIFKARCADPEFIKGMSDRQKEIMSNPQMRARLSKANKAAWERPGVRERSVGAIRRKYQEDEEFRKRMAALNVLYRYERWSLDGKELLENYDCVKDFAAQGYHRGCVSMVCNGIRNNHKGFLWKRYPVKHLTTANSSDTSD